MAFIETNDLRVYYVERGAGEPVLFVHGNWSTALSWEPVLGRLPESYRGIAYDVRGRGRTEGADNGYTMQELADDLLIFTDALGLERFHLVGHSLGSAIAMQFALDHADRLRSLVVVAPAWVDGMPAAFDVPAAQEALKSNKAIFSQAYRAMMPTLDDEAFFARLADEGHEQRLEATLRNLPALVNWRPGDNLQRVGVPSLVISGELDILTGGANAERAAQALGTQHVIMQGAGHSPNIESPQAFLEVLIEFLARSGREDGADHSTPAMERGV